MSENVSLDKGVEQAIALTIPRRFKTAFIFYSSERHKEIKEELAEKGIKEKTTNIAKMVSKEWHEMSPEEREFWEEKSRDDQYRYAVEMTAFHEAQKRSKVANKDPNAPKRPMSAFLAFSNQRRASLKRANPQLTNADLSKILSQMWKEAPPEIKKTYIDQEAHLRAQYKDSMSAWRKNKTVNTATTTTTTMDQETQNGPIRFVERLQTAMVSPVISSGAPSVTDSDSTMTQASNCWDRQQHVTQESYLFPTEQQLEYLQQGFWQSQHETSASSPDQQNTECMELLELYKQPIHNIYCGGGNQADLMHDELIIFLKNMGDV